jgi:hypothetical protein
VIPKFISVSQHWYSVWKTSSWESIFLPVSMLFYIPVPLSIPRNARTERQYFCWECPRLQVTYHDAVTLNKVSCSHKGMVDKNQTTAKRWQDDPIRLEIVILWAEHRISIIPCLQHVLQIAQPYLFTQTPTGRRRRHFPSRSCVTQLNSLSLGWRD